MTQKHDFHRWPSAAEFARIHSVVDIYVQYEGDLHCTVKHGPSSATLVTDAPVDNHGRGESFSPTDLVATGLGTCVATVMGIASRKHGFLLEGTRVHVKKTMSNGPPRRIARLAVEVTFPRLATQSVTQIANGRATLEHEANQCPVRVSLLDAIEVPMHFDWQTE
ncbi:MAG: OsmC family protein [Polyangiaceae bacterium]